jgi:hypothetical protein
MPAIADSRVSAACNAEKPVKLNAAAAIHPQNFLAYNIVGHPS